MLVYHYSKERYPELLTADLQGKVTEEKRKQGDEFKRKYGLVGPYYDHVSFLIHPAPVDFLGSIYPKDHHTWAEGNELWEHVVEVEDMDLYGWDIVESPIDMFFLDHVWWFDNDRYRDFMMRLQMLAGQAVGYRGSDTRSLIKKLTKMPPNLTRRRYVDGYHHRDFKYNEYKYAAGVPHLMAYTHRPIAIKEARKVVVEAKPIPTFESWTQW